MITKKDVLYVSDLARLSLGEEDIELYTTQLQRILAYVQKLSELDTNGIEPTTYTVPQNEMLREDRAVPSLSRDEALRNAPQAERGCFKVPKIIE